MQTRIPTPRGELFAQVWNAHKPASEVALVMLHDSLGCVDMWRDFPQQLAHALNCRVIAYDRLGFGRSDTQHQKIASNFIDTEPGQDFAHVLAHFDIKRFVVLGHSVGGVMAVQVAAQYPQQCLAAVCISAIVFNEDITVASVTQAKTVFQDPAQRGRLAKYHAGNTQWVLDSWTETWLSPAFANWSLLPVLKQVVVPLLWIQGRADEYATTRHAEYVLQTATKNRCQIDLFHDVGHFPHRERPLEVLQKITCFVTANTNPSSLNEVEYV